MSFHFYSAQWRSCRRSSKKAYISRTIWTRLAWAGFLASTAQPLWANGEIETNGRMDVLTHNEIVVNADPDNV